MLSFMRDVLVMVRLHNSRTELGHHLNHVIPQLHLIVLCAPVSPGLSLHTVQLQTLALRNKLSRQEIKHEHQVKGVDKERMQEKWAERPCQPLIVTSSHLYYNTPNGILPTPSHAAVPKSDGGATQR